MKDKIHFVTLFPNCPNYGLVKDVGQIPYMLGKEYEKFDTELVSCNLDLNGTNVDLVDGLTMTIIKNWHNDFLGGLFYILKNAKRIDWLNIYHYGRKAFLWNKIFKILNPKGKTYLKLDMDYVTCDKLDTSKQERKLFTKSIHKMDIVSVETKGVLERISKYTDKEICLIANGYCEWPRVHFDFKNKNNVFLTVGRLGTNQKATEVLMEAFALSAYSHNWSLRLVGSVEPEFQVYIDDFYKRYSKIRERIVFVGSIDNRIELMYEYINAKVFVLPSRWESFGLVLPEALSCGCRLIVSDKVTAANEVTNENVYGSIVPADNIIKLKEEMIRVTEREYTSIEINKIIDYAKNSFSWKSICKELENYLI